MLVQTLENLEENVFYSGCIITEIRDYRIAASPSAFDTKYVLLRPSPQVQLLLFLQQRCQDFLISSLSLLSVSTVVELRYHSLEYLEIRVVFFRKFPYVRVVGS